METQQTSSITRSMPAPPKTTTGQLSADLKGGSHMNGVTVAPAVASEAFDEVAFLIDDGNFLEEPPLCNDNDQDYDIAGSQNDLDLTLQLDSPYESSWYCFRLLFLFSLFSLFFLLWFGFVITHHMLFLFVDCVFLYHCHRYSHANYRQYMNQMPSAPWGVPLHCDLKRLQTPTGIIRVLLVVSWMACV